jgi:hypothetical protein
MAHQNLLTRFTHLVHRSVSDGIFRAVEADALATEIANRRSWINRCGHGRLFATLQVVLADEVVLCLTRMFDPPNKKHPTQSIPAVLEFLEKKAAWLPIKDRSPLERALVGRGFAITDARGLSNADLTRRVVTHFRGLLPNPDTWRTDRLGTAIRALRFRRNKQVAHTQRVSPRERIRADWEDSRRLLAWALGFADVVGSAYLGYFFLASDGKTFLADGIARTAAKDLGVVLDQAGLHTGRYRRKAR